MKALILDGSRLGDPTGVRVHAALVKEIQSREWEVEDVLLREKKIGFCAGDYFCWIRTPGVCNIDDDNRKIAQAVIDCDLLIYLTPVTFGGYSSDLKRAVEHLIQNSLPFFAMVDGEIHHPQRYARTPKLLAIGWLDTPMPVQESIFHFLVRRNAIGKHIKIAVSGVTYSDRSDEHLAEEVKGWLRNIEFGLPSPMGTLPSLLSAHLEHSPIRSAILLVGSPSGRKSNSQALGGYLLEQLSLRGIQVEAVQLYPALGSPEKVHSLLDKIDASDVTVLAFPLYNDGLPAGVTRFLELISAHRAEKSNRPGFMAIVNSGFPEANQNDTALTICAAFAAQARFTWVGGLALGAGQAVVNQTPLNELGHGGSSIREALNISAESLVKGDPIPKQAAALMGKHRIPRWLFILIGGMGWKSRARKYGVDKSMRRQPYGTV